MPLEDLIGTGLLQGAIDVIKGQQQVDLASKNFQTSTNASVAQTAALDASAAQQFADRQQLYQVIAVGGIIVVGIAVLLTFKKGR